MGTHFEYSHQKKRGWGGKKPGWGKAASYFPADFTGIGNNKPVSVVCFHKRAES